MMRKSAFTLALLLAAAPLAASEPVRIERIDAASVALLRDRPEPVAVYLSDDPVLDAGDELALPRADAARVVLPLAAASRRYVLLQPPAGDHLVVAERVLPLEQGSNFRDIGGYRTRDGRMVRWGRAFRSGAMPLLSEADYALLGQLQIGAVIDLRSLEERDVAADQLDDRTGALFLSNDYSIAPLMRDLGQGDGENLYAGMEQLLRVQFRALFNRLLAGEGAVVYHCSAGQDRTGMATALIYDLLGVDRETIVADYHLSTALRRPQWEMPDLDPAEHADNPIVQYYMAARAAGRTGAEPLYTPSGQSHIVQFFAHLDASYGGSAGYAQQVLGVTPEEVERLRELMLY